MTEHGKTAQQARRGDESALSAAVLRINASLDVDTVLREVVDGARALTGARYGAIATVDERGAPLDFVTSGLTEEEHRALESWPDGLKLFGHVGGLAAPLRLPDLHDYARSLGCSPLPVPCRAFQGTPLRHLGALVGGFFLAEKAGGFTDADEAVLVLFASQAAAAVANAGAHRDERRARARLEALVETAPVGVVVFDAASGGMASSNREAKRITAELATPGSSIELLARTMTCRRADGREVTLDDLGRAGTVRSEEVELSVPDGRRVRTLLDATPIHAADGALDAVVVTMQDLAPLEALERSRAEFLAMVSRELRAPLTSIKGAAATALGAARELDAGELREFLRIVEGQADRMDALIGDLLDAGRIGAGTLPVAPAPVDLAALVERARGAFAGAGGGHDVLVDLPPDLPFVMADERRIVQVLTHLLAAAAQRAPGGTPIRVAAAPWGGAVEVAVVHEVTGVTPERLAGLFHDPAVAGREGDDLGLAICKGLVEAHGGRIRAESDGVDGGMRIAFTLPAADEAHAAGAPAAERTPVLVVDADPRALRHLRDTLAAAGYAPAVTADPAEVSRLLEEHEPHLVLLDALLTGAGGAPLLESVPALADLPVILVCAYGREAGMEGALAAGAVDYLVKPFPPAELLARVRAALRRIEGPEPFMLGALAIDYVRRRVSVAGRPVRLTVKEYELLRVLSAAAGRVVSYEALLRQVWGARGRGDVEPVRNFVRKLRRKLGDDAGEPAWILNERGVGYRMPEPGGS